MKDPAAVGRKRRRIILLAAGCPLLLAGVPEAAPVAVGDAGFEGNSLGPGGYHYDLGPEWQETGGAGNGSGFEEYIVGFSAEGTDHLGMENGHLVWQDLGVVYQANTLYRLTVAVGNRPGVTQGGNLSVYSLADSTGPQQSRAMDASTIAAGSFVDGPVVEIDTTLMPSLVGRTVRILLQAGGSGRSHFDHIRLDATSLLIPGAAVIGLVPASAITAASATLHANINDVGAGAPAVTFYYGTSDGGRDPAAWAKSVALPGTHSGPVAAQVSGLQPGLSYFFTARATNVAGVSWALQVGAFETLALPAVVTNLPARAITPFGAELGAEVTDSGGDNPQVTIYHGTVDGGTNAGLWQRSVPLGSVSGQAFGVVSGLTQGTTHHYRAYAENSAGGVWAPSSASLVTPVVTRAGISNRNPDGITGTTASIRGEIDSTGGDPPVVTVFYGPVDGQTDVGAWAKSIVLGRQDGKFSIFVANLTPNTDYWFRCRAVNAAGESWSGNSRFFRTTGMVPSGVVVNEIHFDPEDESTPGEFIELHNPGDEVIDLGGWSLTDAVGFTFPAGTEIEPGGYLVVAQDPALVLAVYGVNALGPWTGRLDNDGEQIDLRDDDGVVRDQVAYGAGFPWPTAARGGGASAELIDPSLDNGLGGSWRESGAAGYDPVIVPAVDGNWRCRKGTSEASSPVNAWRYPDFSEDASWLGCRTPVGYGDGDDNTVLSDMRYNYSSVYLLHEFVLRPDRIPQSLTLRVYVDDGAVVWINGQEVARMHVPAGELAYNDTAYDHNAGWEGVTLNDAANYLVGGTNVIAAHGLNVSLGGSSDFSLDVELINNDPPPAAGIPSPGFRNGVYSTAAPPQIRQVGHSPKSPVAGVPVTVTARITDPDGVGPVRLEYQLVEPGAYIRKADAAYQSGWVQVPMRDDGGGGDLAAGDFTFTAVLPGNLQVHRRLVRYRIRFEDGNGLQATAPWPDDQQPNFAYFVHNGAPAWSGVFAPGGASRTFPTTLLDDLPVYHLLANPTDITNCQYDGSYKGTHMSGTLVYDGVVYDHIEFENRGEASTYVSGKNKWRFHFNRARGFSARDNLGKLYQSSWSEMNFDACSSPWASVHRGMAGVEEALSYRLYGLCGVPSPRTHFVHFRVVDDAVEASATSQYVGDLWGLYLVIEQPSGAFLNDRGLPDGNVYKIEGGAGNKKEQGLGQPVDSSDWNAFFSASAGGQSEAWWRANLDMDRYYSFRACDRISGNVDLREGYNHYYYHHPDGHWVPIPWDLDMMFIAETHWPGYLRAQNSLSQPVLAMEFRNRARELLDLMVSDGAPGGGQIGQLIDEYAQIVNPGGQALTWADLDAHLWNHHPQTNGDPAAHSGQTNHKGNFFHTPYGDTRMGGNWSRMLASADHEGSMRYLLDYATNTYSGGTWVVGNGVQQGYGYEYLKQEAADAAIPNRPVLSYAGAAGFPASDLRFTSSAFGDPQGAGTFGGMHWRIAEIAAPGVVGFTAGEERRYEVNAVWDSGVLPVFTAMRMIPVSVARAGHTYRVRVRHRDTTGRWSHWSEPAGFVAAAADVTLWQNNLVVSEFMYHPPEPAGVDEESVSTDKDDYEFIELWNMSPELTLDLSDLRFTKGVDFDFSGSALTLLPPAGRVLVVKNLAAFEARYGTGLPVAGEFSGNLGNGGDELKLSYGAGATVREFSYGDAAPWPVAADGDGFSLVLIDPLSIPNHALASNWAAGGVVGGTPGEDEPAAPGSFEEWRREQFTAVELLDLPVSGADADPDNDGRSNLIEWALATLPMAADLPVMSFAWIGAGGNFYPAIRFRRPKGAVGLVYELLACDDMQSWQVVATGATSEGPLGDGVEQVVMRDNRTDSAPRRFLRLRVSAE